jgi:hypothetical protein
MNDAKQKTKERMGVRDFIAWPFMAIVFALIIIAPVWTITGSPYAKYATPATIIVFAVMWAIILLYNKIRLGVWLPGRKKDLI